MLENYGVEQTAVTIDGDEYTKEALISDDIQMWAPRIETGRYTH